MQVPSYATQFAQRIVNALCVYNVQKVLPAVYTDELSYYELLSKMQSKVNEVISSVDNLNDWQAAQDTLIAEMAEAIQTFIDGGYLDSFERFVDRWLAANMERIIKDSIRQVYFGLTDDGYFCAYIPESWSEITFDMGTVYGRSDYGRLILRFDAQGTGVIDNTYSYSLAQPRAIDSLVSDLEVTTNRTDMAYDTLFTNLDVEV